MAGIIDEMGIEEEINRTVGRNSREKVSAGVIVEISPTEIGNERYYEKALYQTASQVKVLARKLRELKEKKGYVDAYQTFYSDPSILSTEFYAQ